MEWIKESIALLIDSKFALKQTLNIMMSCLVSCYSRDPR